LRTLPTIITIVALSSLVGCNGTSQKPGASGKEKTLLTVDFQEGQALQYKFASSREIEVEWEPGAGQSKSGKRPGDKFSESMEMVMTYTPVKADPYGLTSVKGTCDSVKVTRSKGTVGRGGTKDAVEYLPGKSFTLTVGPTGKIEDYSELEKLIHEIGNYAFREQSNRGKIKDPDMTSDFITTQWFLWDSISTIEDPQKGVEVGQSWKSKLPIPAPMPVMLRRGRDVTYTLAEIQQGAKGQLAVIKSSYAPAESVPESWPIPYSGSFQMAGTFGFLRGYKIMNLQGEGEELFNLDSGRVERRSQHYQTQLEALLPMPLSVNPRVTIKQNLTMELLKGPSSN